VVHVLHRSAVALTLAAFASLALAAPHARADTSGADIVGFVNAQRAANGIPAGVVEDTAASAACAAWAGGGPDVPFPAGALTWDDHTYGSYFTGPWTASSGPFDRNVWALPYVLAPRLAALGAADVDDRGCATVMTPGTRPAPAQDVTYSYPGDGVQDVRTSAPFRETEPDLRPPSTSAETGPALYALFDGPDLGAGPVPAKTEATAATLTGPDGIPLAVDVHDTAHRLGPGVPTEVQMVPHDGLAPFTTYHAAVTADVTPPGGTARSFTHAWSFTTGALENSLDLYEYGDIDLATLTTTGTFTFGIRSRAPQVTLTATSPDATITQTSTSTDAVNGARFTLPLARAVWHVCFTSGGPGTDYRPASRCENMTSFGPPTPPTPTPTPSPVVNAAAPAPVATVAASLARGAKARLRGRVLSVPVRCSAACSLKVAGTIKAGGKTIRLTRASASRKSAGTVTVKYMLSKAAARRLRTAHTRRLALTIVPKGGATVRRTVAIGAK
jgi:hypothetical protein